MQKIVSFNKPFLTGKETGYIVDAVSNHKLAGDGVFTKKCHEFFENKYHFSKVLLTTSCTGALEMAAILLNIKEGDEVIAPSYTFVSTVNSFVLRGAKIVFADSNPLNPNIDEEKIEELITPRTRVIITVHYAGIACEMDKIKALAKKYNLHIVEDAAQAIDSYYNDVPLGSIGSFSAFSFHDTKNITCGEGGMLVINDRSFVERAEMIRLNGTNKAQFLRGEVEKYGWTDMGSSFLPSEITAAFLFAQLERLQEIQQRRKEIWEQYLNALSVLKSKGRLQLPHIPSFATNNGHIFYLVCNSLSERVALIDFLKENKISSAFHYLPLHKSDYYKHKHDGRALPFAELYANCLVRLPMYYELETAQVDYVCSKVLEFFNR